MTRRRLLALVVGPTLVVGLLVALAVVVGVLEVRGEVEEADRAASAYRTSQERFTAAAERRLDRVDVEDPRKVRKVAATLVDDLPSVPAAPERGAEGSADYRAAQGEAAALRTAVTDLADAAEEAVGVRAFVLAANRALDLDPRTILPEPSFVDGAPVRERLLPRVRQALADFERAKVPEGAGSTSAEVREALATLLREGETLAAELDAGRGYRFEYGVPFGRAEASVEALAKSARADLREAVDRVVGDPAAP